MSNLAELLIIIPARGGSKGISRKNVRELAGLPLIAYTITTALESHLGRVIVSTDDDEIASVSRAYGAEVPFMRPHELATDEATGFAVIQHALAVLEDKINGQDVCVLQPTSPLRSIEDLLASHALFRRTRDPVISVTHVTKPASWHHGMDDDGLLYPLADTIEDRRQDARAAVIPNGAIYLSSQQSLELHQGFYTPSSQGWLMPPERSIDIDTDLDWLLAEGIITGKLGEVRARLSINPP